VRGEGRQLIIREAQLGQQPGGQAGLPDQEGCVRPGPPAIIREAQLGQQPGGQAGLPDQEGCVRPGPPADYTGGPAGSVGGWTGWPT
jgi:hypothetical protein